MVRMADMMLAFNRGGGATGCAAKAKQSCSFLQCIEFLLGLWAEFGDWLNRMPRVLCLGKSRAKLSVRSFSCLSITPLPSGLQFAHSIAYSRFGGSTGIFRISATSRWVYPPK